MSQKRRIHTETAPFIQLKLYPNQPSTMTTGDTKAFLSPMLTQAILLLISNTVAPEKDEVYDPVPGTKTEWGIPKEALEFEDKGKITGYTSDRGVTMPIRSL